MNKFKSKNILKCLTKYETLYDNFNLTEILSIITKSNVCPSSIINVINYYKPNIKNLLWFNMDKKYNDICKDCKCINSQCMQNVIDNIYDCKKLTLDNESNDFLLYFYFPRFGRVVETNLKAIKWNLIYFYLKCFLRRRNKLKVIKQQLPYKIVM